MASKKASNILAGKHAEMTSDVMLTQVLKNTVTDLQRLRDTINDLPGGPAAITDVRQVRHHAITYFRGFEKKVSYTHLIALIAEMEEGVAALIRLNKD